MNDDEHARYRRGTWSYEIWRSNSRAHADFPRTTSHFGRIFVDKGKRKATCFACNEQIVKGTPRFVLMCVRPQVMTFRNGGRANYAKSFAHVACIRKLLKGVPAAKDHRQCVGCFVTMDELVVRASTTMNGEWGWLCRSCHEGNQFIACASCGLKRPKGMCSLAIDPSPILDFDIDEDHPAGSVICDSCSLNYGILTLKSQTRQERADKTFDKKVEKAITQVQDWFSAR